MHRSQHDQAAGLRQIMTGHQPKIVSVLSAIPDQHKHRFIPNLAASLSQQDSDVLVVQTGVDSKQYGVSALPALSDVASQRLSINQSVKSSKFGFLATKLHAKHIHSLAASEVDNHALSQVFEHLSNLFEVVLVDAGLNQQHQLPLALLHEHDIMIQLTCDPESIKEAYTLIKKIYSQVGRRSFGIIANSASNEEAAAMFQNIEHVARNYLQVDLEFMGAIPSDQHLNRAGKLGRAVVDAFPLTNAAKAFKALAQRLNYKYPQPLEAELASFV